ncbi:MAG: hypothetical protein BWX79_01966 [Alphaproteobacteria bacterium ADurb.Bin100]|nr:MAG: hypothetical protein BWX79_01966 [Alphaproteobacteria bacterium ADurb.Bin100]
MPPVYCRKIRSSPFSATGVRVIDAPSRNASANAMLPTSRASTGGLGKAAPVPSPGATVITVLMPAWAATSASVGVEPLKMTRVSLPESWSWCSSSRGVYSGFTFTCTAPARKMPMQATGKASRLGSITAMRSPFFTPRRCCSQAANAADWRSTSAKLRVWPKARKAGLSA